MYKWDEHTRSTLYRTHRNTNKSVIISESSSRRQSDSVSASLMISVPTENRRLDTNRKTSSYLSFPAFHLWSQFTNFWFPYWSRARRGPAELGNPDAAAIRGLRDARSSCQSGRAEPRSLRTKPPAQPGRDSYEAKLEIIQRPASSSPSWQGAQRGTNKSTENHFSNKLLSSSPQHGGQI